MIVIAFFLKNDNSEKWKHFDTSLPMISLVRAIGDYVPDIFRFKIHR